jgi:hypothetical protein
VKYYPCEKQYIHDSMKAALDSVEYLAVSGGFPDHRHSSRESKSKMDSGTSGAIFIQRKEPRSTSYI